MLGPRHIPTRPAAANVPTTITLSQCMSDFAFPKTTQNNRTNNRGTKLTNEFKLINRVITFPAVHSRSHWAGRTISSLAILRRRRPSGCSMRVEWKEGRKKSFQKFRPKNRRELTKKIRLGPYGGRLRNRGGKGKMCTQSATRCQW